MTQSAMAELMLSDPSFSGRLKLARAMRKSKHLCKRVDRLANYWMGDRVKECAFWKLLAIKYGHPCDSEHIIAALKRMRRSASRIAYVEGEKRLREKAQVKTFSRSQRPQ